jgi:hypothetical protein
MCDLDRIGWLIAGAAAGTLAAIVLCAIAAIAAGTFYGALGNGALMIAASVAIGLALVSVNVAIQSMGPCVAGACRVLADQLLNALIAAGIALTVLLAALILGIFAASIPWAGTAVAIGLGLGAAALAISFLVIGSKLGDLGVCRSTPPTLGTRAGTGLAIAAGVLLMLAVLTATGGVLLGPAG